MRDVNGRKLLIVGARRGSLGEAVFLEAESGWGFSEILTAGITDEMIKLDVIRTAAIREVLDRVRPEAIICTVGVNEPGDIYDAYLPTLMNTSFAINAIAPLDLLRCFLETHSPLPTAEATPKVFVAVSSNSAAVPRRGSIAYCASKAALSIGLRVAAREEAGRSCLIWGYEPGLLAGTPMTEKVRQRYPEAPLHRMPGVRPNGLSPQVLAARMVGDVARADITFNGCLFRLDAGEL